MIDDTEAGPLRAEVGAGVEHSSDQIVALNLGDRPLDDATSVAVPVFGPAGEVAPVLTAHGFPEPLTTESLDRLVDQLTRCATLITKDTFARTTMTLSVIVSPTATQVASGRRPGTPRSLDRFRCKFARAEVRWIGQSGL